MATKTFFLRNMLSKSCLKLTQFYFERFNNIKIKKLQLGIVELEFDLREVSELEIENHFNELGFSILKDNDLITCEKIKIAAIELIHYSNNVNSLIRNSDYISERLGISYDKISRIFSRVNGVTLEKYLIALKIEKAKELINNNEFTLSEISFMLGYSSVQYLSNQFKKTTGITVSEFKENPKLHRNALEDLI